MQITASRPATFGLETHLSTMWRTVEDFKPAVVVVDPATSFEAAGSRSDIKAVLLRTIDVFKSHGITALLTSLTHAGEPESEMVGLSSLIDSWVLLRNPEEGGERTRTLTIVKSRGMKHSNQERELLLTDSGVDLIDVFIAPDGNILTGSARLAQEAADRGAEAGRKRDIDRKKSVLLQKRRAGEARIAQIKAEMDAETAEIVMALAAGESAAAELTCTRASLAHEREHTVGPPKNFNEGLA